jgi:hypothetical protein
MHSAIAIASSPDTGSIMGLAGQSVLVIVVLGIVALGLLSMSRRGSTSQGG